VTLVEKLAQARASGDYQALFEAVPYSKFLGLTAKHEGAELITTMTYAPHLIGNPALPALHGGTLGALLESAAIFELLVRAETIVLPKTITLTIDYLRAAEAGRDVVCHATCYKRTRNVAFTRAIAYHDDPADPIASSVGTFMLSTKPGGKKP
jgi:uncharacterized protein (TIGR00369 family)